MPPLDTAAEPDDLRASLEAAIPSDTPDTNSAAPASSADAAPESPSLPSDEPGAATSQEPGGGDTRPPRNPDGTFAPKSDAAPVKAAPVAQTATPETPSKDTAKASDAPASTPANAPPVGWTADEKALWATLPPAVQAAVSRREQQMEQGGRQWSEEKQRLQGMIAPVAEMARRRGLSADQGLNALLVAQQRLDSDPPSAIRWLAQSYGVDLATLAGQSPAQVSQDNPQQPDIRALVQQAVAPFLAPVQERFAAQDREREMSMVQLVEQFSAAPGHEHFGAVESELMDLIPGIKARNPAWSHTQVLQEAYDRAVYANPTTRQQVLAASSAAAEEKRRQEAAARVTKARTAAVSVTGSPSGLPASAPKDSIRAEIEAAFAGG